MRGWIVACLVASTAFAGCSEPEDNAWAVEATQLDRLVGLVAEGARPVRVAVLDTGIDLDHPALAHLADGRSSGGEIVAEQAFVGGSLADQHGHGTFVAGLLAARPARGLSSLAPGDDVQGFAPPMDLLVGRVCVQGDCSLFVLAQALRWALDQDADVISMSLGFTTAEVQQQSTSSVLLVRDLLAQAEAKGVLVVAAASNRGQGPLFPASEPTVLAVGAVDRDLQPRDGWRCSGSVDLLAPGQGIVGPWAGGGTASMDGTSAAVPFVVAAATGLMAVGGDPDDEDGVEALRKALTSSAMQVGTGCWLLRAETALHAYALP